jgi:hypothetical protein
VRAARQRAVDTGCGIVAFSALLTGIQSSSDVCARVPSSACASAAQPLSFTLEHQCRTNVRDFYAFGRAINRGLSAEVFEGTSLVDGGKVALKVYFLCDRNAVHETITEHVCMSRAASEHVLQCHGIMFDGKRPCLILSLAAQSLRDFLQARYAPLHAPCTRLGSAGRGHAMRDLAQ